MIIVIGEYPKNSNLQDGMMRRVYEMDRLFEGKKRIYVHLYWKSAQLRPLEDGNAEVIEKQMNLFSVRDMAHLWKILVHSQIIYCHSLYNVAKVLPYIFLGRVVIDWHGIVSAEAMMHGQKLRGYLFYYLEWLCCQWKKGGIYVSKNMADYYKRRMIFPKKKLAFYIPIGLNQESEWEGSDKEYKPEAPQVIYSGGTQAWQNIELICELVKKAPSNYKFELLTPNREGISRYFTKGIPKNCRVLSVHPRDINKNYVQSHYGLLLRDESIVNRLSSPTKMTEYMKNGVLPVVLSPSIGDFEKEDYRYIQYKDLLDGHVYSKDKWYSFVRENKEVIDRLMQENLEEQNRLVKCLCAGNNKLACGYFKKFFTFVCVVVFYLAVGIFGFFLKFFGERRKISNKYIKN